MAVSKLSQWEAVLLEVIRHHGIEEEELLALFREGDYQKFYQIDAGKYDFSDLLELARKEWATFEHAVREGYQVKFSTYGGIKTLLRLRFGLEADKDYQSQETYLDLVKLKREELGWLRSTISPNWSFLENEGEDETGKINVRIQLT
ncbi:MAG TPA: hypothetical protein VE710_10430 [Candidatus Bathyarchaeia archaeon]|nr:hypothetical protein [Candidatus Bathyarchaeia archaeon]